jgi:head-tail adaptor
MQTRYPPASIGEDRHLVTFDAPGAAVPDGEGGFTRVPAPLAPPTWYVRIRPATARDVERAMAGTIITHRSHVIHGRYHPGVTLAARMHFEGRTYQVTSVINIDERDREMELIADLQDQYAEHAATGRD